MTKSTILAAFLAAAAISSADQAVYSTKLENGWQDWSWAKVAKAGKTMTVTAKPWQAAYFHHDPQKSAFSTVSFRVNGGASGGQKLQLRATADKKPLKESYLAALKPGWTTVTVSFKSLGLTGQPFDGFWIQSQKAGTFQISDVVLKTK